MINDDRDFSTGFAAGVCGTAILSDVLLMRKIRGEKSYRVRLK
jgi:hypothetical protein